MLDRAKLMRELNIEGQPLFLDYSEEYESVHMNWKALCADRLFLEKVCAYPSYGLVVWQGDVGTAFPVKPLRKPYQLDIVTGKQIGRAHV